ncbi:MAG: Non-ribosomal peptide synthetase [Ramalina farinacea]|uniref:Non-ribosomal peptide synthetase n=1 Tax=Ramalina farinacea TaxID=258253 RepID=A0AA43QJT7_9LECA|nr:Non-ribosomal peptide synthetase [Ramalina farinacea]
MQSPGIEPMQGSTPQVVSQYDLKKLWGWNDTVPKTVDQCFTEVVAEQVQSRPDASAVCAWDGELTYGELNRLATGLADWLIDLGVRPDTLVPLCFEKSMWTTVAILGVLKAGGAFVLLDPSLPKDRLQAFVRQVDATLILSSSSTQSLSSRLAENVVIVDSALFAGRDSSNHENRNVCKANPSSTAYVIFTSGSTGIPKGVVITHRNVTSAVSQHVKHFHYTADTRIYDFASYSFGASINNVLAALTAGGCLCVPSDNDRRSNLAGSLTSFRATAVFLTPSMAELLSPQKTPSLRSIIFGGEPVRPKDVRPWWGQVKVITAYGCSECTSISTINAHAVSPEEVTRIGKGAAGVTWVVDPENHESLLSPGCAGELLIEGPLVGRGYLNELEKTAAAFIEDPAWLLQGAPGYPGRHGRLYKTGDLVRYTDNGNLTFLGRKDEQVKIRGQRVELGEVEHHVQECMPDVKQVVAEVVAPHGENSGAVLVAFLQTENQMTRADRLEEAKPVTAKILPIMAEVENRLAQLLPSYMLPTAYFSMQELPIGTTGKLNRKRLREIGASFSVQELAEMQTSRQGPKQQPRSEVEQQMQGLWAQALAIEPATIGLDDTFFRLGGNSITAMKVVGKAREVGLQLTVADIFCCPSLQDIASQALASAGKVASKILPTRLKGPVEQSFAQGRLWFLEQLYPGSTWYLIPCVMRFRGSLRLDALNSALLALEIRHETLRTTFSTHGGVHMQEVQGVRVRDLNVIDISPEDKESLMLALSNDATTPFDLENEPGWRVSVYRLGKEDHILSIVMHHIISDGWSVDILRKELAAFYAAAIHDQDPLSQVDPLPIQYRDYSLWQKQQDQSEEHERQLEYWVTQLETSQPAELLCDKPRPAALSGKAGMQQLRIDRSLYYDLQRFCSEQEATPFIVLLAAFRATHYRLTGVGDATIGSPNANRDRGELKDMVGFFVNLQCIRVKIEDESFEGLVKQVRASTIASFANQDVPFEAIVSRLQKGRDLSRHPLAQIIFAVHSQLDLRQFTLEGLNTEQIPMTPTPRFDLEFHFFQEQQALQGEILFSTDLYNPETISNILSTFRRVLEQVLHEPKIPVATLALLTDDSYSALVKMGLIQVGRTKYPRESSIVDIFRQQVAICPHKSAVKDSSTQLTYAQLDRKSDTLAWWLRRRSFAPETLVGVFSGRSCETIIACLAILKANLAYLPFDVKTPPDRMETILRSLQGHRLILLGTNVQSPPVQPKDLEFVYIAGILDHLDNTNLGEPALAAAPSATSLAYVMFTSGSTGRPKGVMVEHRGIVRLVKQSNMVQHDPTANNMAHISNIAFDASAWEIYVTLLNGGTLICIDAMTVLDHKALAKIFSSEKIEAALITPALLKQYLSGCPAALSALDTLYVGGDRADPQDIRIVRGLVRGKIINAYGPTENSVVSTLYCLPEEERCTNGVPIGRALSNSGAYVVDQQLHLVPLGVVGELVVTGDGLARGYTDSQQDSDRFVSIKIGGQRVRAYRTGDYVRYRPADRQLEYFGRMDGQIKIRGQRVELGEIEHALRSHGSVNGAVAVLQYPDDREAQLVSFVTIHESVESNTGPDGDDAMEHVDAWEGLFDKETYTAIDNVRPEQIGRDFLGWTSMYDGSEIDKVEMNEWLDDTIATISSCKRSMNLLELGSGSGMVLFNLTQRLQNYIGLDPSRKAVDFITKTAKSIRQLAGKVHMYKGTAADISRLPAPISPNLVVINSVAQYFPSQDYVLKVVEELLRLKGVETLFFGDVRSYAMYEEFRATKTLHMTGETATKGEVRQKMTELEKAELEFLIAPAFFTALPSRYPDLIEHVEILPKRMKAINELSCYRYSAIVHVKSQSQVHRRKYIHQVGEDEWIDFMKDRLDPESLFKIVQQCPSTSFVAVSNIPHSKTIFERHVIDSLNNGADIGRGHSEWLLSARQNAQQCPSMSAVDLVELAQSTGCEVAISWARQSSQRGGLDAIFHHQQSLDRESKVMFRFPIDHQVLPPHLLSSRPLQQQMKQTVREQLHQRLQSQLPSYMVPQVITILDKMPINENGKVDRRALAESVQRRTAARASMRQPTTDLERQIQKIWAQVLSVEPTTIGVDDNFFQLGGDSISAMRLVGLARAVNLQLTVAQIFKHPGLQDMSCLIGSSHGEHPVEALAKPFTAIDVTNGEDFLQRVIQPKLNFSIDLISDVLPTTDFQEWIIEENLRNPPLMLTYFSVELTMKIDPIRMEGACAAIIKHHEILRTVFVGHNDRHLQVILRDLQPQFTQYDVNGDLEAFSTALCHQDRAEGLQLGAPSGRFMLLCVDENRYRLIIRLSHTQYDGFCIPQLLNDLASAYHGEHISSAGNFSAFVYDHIQRAPLAHEYWRRLLHGSNMTRITSHLRPLDTTSSILVEASGLVDLRALPREFTAATLATASWAKLLSKMTSKNDVVFGRVVAGRSSEMMDLEKMVGPCLNIAPMRVQFLPEWSTVDLLTAIQEQQVSSGPFESTGITEITNHCTSWPKGTDFDSFIRIVSSRLTDAMSPFGGPIGAIKHNVPTNSKFSITCNIGIPEMRFHLIAYSNLIDQKTADWLVNELSTIAAHLLISSDIFDVAGQ